MTARVEVTVLDPGDRQGMNCNGFQPYMPDSHPWAPVTISLNGSVWYCPKCRRVERRELIEEPAE